MEEMGEKVQEYSEKEVQNIPRPFSKEPIVSLEETREEILEEENFEEPIKKSDPKKAKLGAKITVFSIDTAIQTILTIVAKSDIPGATAEEKKELQEIWEEYYLETGKEPPLWLMLVTMNVSVYGDKVYTAIQKRKESGQTQENGSSETNQTPVFNFVPQSNRMKREPIQEPKKEMDSIDIPNPEPEPQPEPEPKPEPTPEPTILREGPQEEIQPPVIICQNENCNNELTKKQKNFCSIKCRNEYINKKRNSRK
jgi:hypothetical protein